MEKCHFSSTHSENNVSTMTEFSRYVNCCNCNKEMHWATPSTCENCEKQFCFVCESGWRCSGCGRFVCENCDLTLVYDGDACNACEESEVCVNCDLCGDCEIDEEERSNAPSHQQI